MKKTILYGALSLVILSACKTSQLTPNNDDVYTSPTEQRRLAQIAAQKQAQKEADDRAQQEQARLAQQAKDNANPAYQDPQADPDDYYDYKYASMINRFNNPVQGAGYYDSRYTNAYTYNQDPSMYGSSIYNSYNWMPSSQFNGYSSGMGMGYGSSMYGNPYYGSSYGMGMGYGSSMGMGYGSSMGMGYGSSIGMSYGMGMGYGSPYGMSMGYGYNPYGMMGYGYGSPYGMMGYGMGYGSSPYGYNSFYGSPGWGYYNSYDPNSGYSSYAPRTSHSGGNGGRTANPGMPVEGNARTAYFQQVAQQQQNTPRFTEPARAAMVGNNRGQIAGLNNSNGIIESPHNNVGRSVVPAGSNGNIANSNNNSAVGLSTPRGGNNQPMRETQQMNINQNNGFNNNGYNTNRSWNNGGNSNINSGGGRSSFGGGGGGFSSPRGGGGGGGGRR